MPTPGSPSPTTIRTCASCGARVDGRFCAHCGTPATPGGCRECQSALSPGARFCHRCGCATGPVGGSVPPGREQTAWIVAGGAIVVAILLVAWSVGRSSPGVPDMGNVGNAGAPGAVAALDGPVPDISRMTPREQFDRLYDKIMTAAEGGDSAIALQFAPMGLGAYAQLDSVNTDARYHAAMIHLMIGEFDAAVALADTVLTQAPGHLFGYVIRGEVADRQNRTAALTRAYQDFLDRFDAELRSGRIEYTEHRPVLDDFRTRARATLGR